MHKYFHHIEAVSHLDLAPESDPSEFPNIWGKFCFLFYQCNLSALKKRSHCFSNLVLAVPFVLPWDRCWPAALFRWSPPWNNRKTYHFWKKTTFLQIVAIWISVILSSKEWTSYLISLRCRIIIIVKKRTELVFLNVYGAQDSIPRNEFRQPM